MELTNDLKEAVEQWESGAPMRLLLIGHRNVRQQLTYECIFRALKILEAAKDSHIPETIHEVNAIVDEPARDLDLLQSEREAAASLIFVALKTGLAAALAGHADQKYSMLSRGNKRE